MKTMASSLASLAPPGLTAADWGQTGAEATADSEHKMVRWPGKDKLSPLLLVLVDGSSFDLSDCEQRTGGSSIGWLLSAQIPE